MNWQHVHLIFMRELNDQLRDRRTLFTITVLPILLYPLLGMLMMQIAQFKRDYTVRVQVIGQENWPSSLPLIHPDGTLAVETYDPNLPKLVEFDMLPWNREKFADRSPEEQLEQWKADSRLRLSTNEYDAVLIVAPNFEELLATRLNDAKITGTDSEDDSDNRASGDAASETAGVGTGNAETGAGLATASTSSTLEISENDGLHLIANLARDHSQIASQRLNAILGQWKRDWTADQLADAGVNPRLVEPLQLAEMDTAESSVKRAMLWSKVLPFVMLVWALTGAFYPAIDLCAGEKERGTLETLLSSPARRREIVWGKLLTISVFSVGSALLNLMSMHVTAGLIVKQLGAAGGDRLAEALGPMPFSALGWLVLLLIPMAAFFSALALAVAALARSTKEGQYYLMPLLLVTLPLVALPMLPSLELNLGTSLVPVAGAVFLVRSLIEGDYSAALVHLPIVMIVTLCCCALSIRWAIRQFESESVMFREADRWNLKLWVHHLWRDRGKTASPPEALLCGIIIIVAMFFAQFAAGSSLFNWRSFVISTSVVQIAIILMPAILMAAFLTKSIRHSLRIHRVQPTHLAAAVLLGIALHPSYMVLGSAISSVYSLSSETQAALEMVQTTIFNQPLWAVLLLMAVLPAICEELTFRGFIFGGLLHQGGVLRAIVVSALFFGFTHSVLQQSLAACVMGLLLGIVAWRTGGVICTIVIHLINNTLSIGLAHLSANGASISPLFDWAVVEGPGGWEYSPQWITMSVMFSVALLFVIARRDEATRRVATAELA